jgi:CheY-like chemotaxis protein/HPt (histidine-containing phosphotransfer) domain-containing protein
VQGLAALVVDDNATNRRILQEMLTNWGIRPTVVEGGREALAALEQAQRAGDPFGLVLLDGMMPGMDGFTLAERIGQDAAAVPPTLMMLSSANRRDDAARCRELGVAAYLTKPIRQSALLDAIMTSLGSSADRAAGDVPEDAYPADLALRPLRLLLAEDNVVNQRLAIRLLEKRGHHVVVAGNGREALVTLDRERFDAVLMDVQMPEMDGFETTAAIRARETAAGRHVPIIAMTAHSLKGDRERCLEVGMDAYVSKPLESKQLFDVLASIVPQAADVGAVNATATATDGAEAFNRAAALKRVDGDLELMKELVELFLGECPQRMAEIREALTRRDAATLQRAAHTLKGSVGNFAAGEAVEAAQHLEAFGRAQDWRQAENAWTALNEAIDRLKPALAEVCQAAVP